MRVSESIYGLSIILFEEQSFVQVAEKCASALLAVYKFDALG